MPPKNNTNGKTQTTTQRLGSVVKSCRDIMRKDKGLNGDLDRLPMLTWIMFLKFLDDMEHLREEEAELEGKRFRPIIQTPYRWRDWASAESSLTGDQLLNFISNDEVDHIFGATDSQNNPIRMAGLLAYLRGLSGNEGLVIARVFEGVVNRMISGYLLRDVINKVNEIHFDSSEELYTLGHLYETMLQEMRDAAGDSGEFYTPRAVVQFMVAVINPQLGETILDPACGTGGFLVESYRHLEQQVQTAEDRQRLQHASIFGQEAKPLPYLLCQMNLVLHGMENPQIDYGNSLRIRLADMGDADRVDIILTNPPFGGEEEAGIKNNFPADKQTSETALLFLQLIMRRLRRGKHGGRAAVVVPNGVLFADGIAARIKEELLKEFNLHTIVRLPNGVFAPYTSILTNILFFERDPKGTQDIWYYQQPLPEGRKNYTKTQPMRFEEMRPCLEWWNQRAENAQAWRVTAQDVLKYDNAGNLLSVNLDSTNPSAAVDLQHRSPEELLESIMQKEQRITEIMLEIQQLIKGKSNE